MRVLAFDIGKQTGYGLLGGKRVLSGSLKVCDRWKPLGQNLNLLRAVLGRLIRTHKPDRVAVALPFLGVYRDTPQNLVPMYCGFGILHMVAADAGVKVIELVESEARGLFLGEFLPSRSADIKAAIMQACRDRGWPCTDDHAGDALCIAAAALEKCEPSRAHQTTPLFAAGH